MTSIQYIKNLNLIQAIVLNNPVKTSIKSLKIVEEVKEEVYIPDFMTKINIS